MSYFRPLLAAYKAERVAGRDGSQFYNRLNASQQALFMFYVYYQHVRKGTEEFYWWSAYFYAKDKDWPAIVQAAAYFDLPELVALLKEVEEWLRVRNYPKQLSGFSVSRDDLHNNPVLHAEMTLLEKRLKRIVPVKKVEQYVRSNRHEF
ncbi:hypothetical protein P6P90_15385 [Ectobacillus antri]|uniref:Uncharacterized protein n=1 Tax=Ectobacillus antri TaxID=2486280 RepID=A0ABT6H9A4_9BACI|nr:hypothetical protein [Ectobacillus antri]MDG4658181.1 hypothetical protein [Ectobacillus antri]MDG5755299.1 hypothetical protein [Ectobacillus antri]